MKPNPVEIQFFINKFVTRHDHRTRNSALTLRRNRRNHRASHHFQSIATKRNSKRSHRSDRRV